MSGMMAGEHFIETVFSELDNTRQPQPLLALGGPLMGSPGFAGARVVHIACNGVGLEIRGQLPTEWEGMENARKAGYLGTAPVLCSQFVVPPAFLSYLNVLPGDMVRLTMISPGKAYLSVVGISHLLRSKPGEETP